MATTYETASYKGSQAVTRPQAGYVELCSAPEDLAVGTTINDVYKFFKLPRGAKLLGAYIEHEELDSHATPTLSLSMIITDGTTTYTPIAAYLGGSAAGYVDTESATYGQQAGWRGKVLGTENFYVSVKVIAASATQVAAPNIQVGIKYTTDVQTYNS